jgi:hypothetical protein
LLLEERFCFKFLYGKVYRALSHKKDFETDLKSELGFKVLRGFIAEGLEEVPRRQDGRWINGEAAAGGEWRWRHSGE